MASSIRINGIVSKKTAIGTINTSKKKIDGVLRKELKIEALRK